MKQTEAFCSGQRCFDLLCEPQRNRAECYQPDSALHSNRYLATAGVRRCTLAGLRSVCAVHCCKPRHTPHRACPACSAQGAVIYQSLRKACSWWEQISDGIAALRSGACWTHLSGDSIKDELGARSMPCCPERRLLALSELCAKEYSSAIVKEYLFI